MKDVKEIRKQLKSVLGYNAKQVSIRKRHYTALVFTVRDASVNVEKVKKFAKDFEKIDYCQYTGEILSGGNTYVEVELSEGVKDELAKEHLEDVMIAMSLVKAGLDYAKINDNATLLKVDSTSCNLSFTKTGDVCGSIEGRNYWIGKDSAQSISLKINELSM